MLMDITINGLTKSYGEQLAVNNISFSLKKGEIVGFIGPNGSGKSTTMKSICGILTPDSGEIVIGDEQITDSKTISIKKHIGYLPENNPLYYEMYITEYLKYTGKIYQIKNLDQRIEEIIKLTGLTPERHKKIAQLSKGYKQRVGLAQALIHDPEILILDEPTTGLDPNQLVEIRSLIKSFSKNKAVLLSTHILQEVEAICDRVIIINKGTIVSDGKTENITGKFETQTIKVEFKNSITPDELKIIEGVIDVKADSENIFYLESKQDDDLREKVFQFAMKNKNSILELQTIKQSLEDVFRQLSGN